MIDFDCYYVLDVPSYMKDAGWDGYLIDLLNSPNNVYARLIFAYTDTGLLDVPILIHLDLDGLTSVSLTNLSCTFRTQDPLNIAANAELMYNAGISVDAASGISIALSVVSRLLDAGCKFDHYENFADFGGMSMDAEEAIEMYSHMYKQLDDQPDGFSCEIPF
jgi:hypothetical protein